MSLKLSPNFYKTTIVLVDDDQAFLDALSGMLASELKHKEFNVSVNALNYINERYQPPTIISNSVYTNIGYKRHDYSRHEELSLIVVDYDMPEMNGLELCRKIENPSIKKILLTGAASQSDVIDAFNRGEIDYFLDKKTESLEEKLNQSIATLQQAHFQQCLEIETLAKEPFSDIFLDSEFSSYFEKVCQEYDVKEHYFDPITSSFTLCAPEKEWILVVLDEERLQEHISIIADEDGPEEWVNKLTKRTHVPYFLSHDGFYATADKFTKRTHIPYFLSHDGFYGPEAIEKENSLFKAQIIQGGKTYYCGIFDAVSVMPSNESDYH